MAVGVETLSRAPKLVELCGLGGFAPAGEESDSRKDGHDTPAIKVIWLPSKDDPNAPGSLILPIAHYPSRIVDLRDGDRTYRIRLATVLERAEDWTRVDFETVSTDDLRTR
jgi:hypothetical protein